MIAYRLLSNRMGSNKKIDKDTASILHLLDLDRTTQQTGLENRIHQ